MIQRPGKTWQALRQLGAGSVSWLPATFPMLAATVLGLPATAASQIREDAPLVGAVADAASEHPRFAVGIRVRSGRELLALLTTGNTPSHQTQPDPSSGLMLLTARSAQAGEPVALGLLGDTLLVASRAPDLKRLGPFVARTLPTAKPLRGSISAVVRQAALAGPVAHRLLALWQTYRAELQRTDYENRQKHGGRAPDFGDPAAALLGMDAVVRSLVELLRSSQQLTLAVEPLPGRLEAQLGLYAQSKGAAAELLAQLRPGKLAPLLQLPKRTVLAVCSRASRSSRDASATATSATLAGLFGDRLGEPDRAQLQQTLAALAQGRGDEASYGVLLSPTGPSVIMRASVDDAAAFDRGARGLFGLLRIRAFAAPLAQFVGDIQVQQDSVRVEGLSGKVRRALVTVKPAPIRLGGAGASQLSLAPTPIQFLWWIAGQTAFGASARNASAALVEVATCEASPTATLGADPAVAAAVRRAGDAVSFALLVQPLALGLGPGHQQSAPILATIGRTGSEGWLRLDVDHAALRSILAAVVQR
jgi:hypothetical protein